MIRIRIMESSDIPEMVLMGFDMHTESNRAGLPFSAEKSVLMAHRILQGENSIGIIAETADTERTEIVGMFCGRVYEDLYGDYHAADDYMLYVKQEYRGSSAAVRLLRAFEAWATARGVNVIFLKQGTGYNIDGIRHLCERLGYETAGYVFRKVLKSEVPCQQA